jgi:uncharacterized membrane protein
MDTGEVAVELTTRLENERRLDGLVNLIRPLASALVASPERRDLLHGTWLGHAVHPLLTDLPIGFWTSANVLDVVGGRASRPAATQLVAWGVASAAPTALTGWAEWAVASREQQRVGVVHAFSNTIAIALYAESWRARRRGRHARGVTLGLAGATVATAAGYLGGHLTAVRKVSTRHPAFDADDATVHG